MPTASPGSQHPASPSAIQRSSSTSPDYGTTPQPSGPGTASVTPGQQAFSPALSDLSIIHATNSFGGQSPGATSHLLSESVQDSVLTAHVLGSWPRGRPSAPERLKRGTNRVRKNGPKPRPSNRKGQDAGRISFRTPSPAPAPANSRATPRLDIFQTTSAAAPIIDPVSSTEPMLLDVPGGTPHILASQRVIGLDDVDIDITVEPEAGIGEYWS